MRLSCHHAVNPLSIPLGLYADRAQIVEQCLKPFGAEFQAPLLRELDESSTAVSQNSAPSSVSSTTSALLSGGSGVVRT